MILIITDSSRERWRMRRKEKEKKEEKVSEVERLAEIERRKTAGDRQKEIEARTIEMETNKRIEELVARRVEEELERRRDQIEEEVLRRVEEAKKIMEEQMMKELEIRKKQQLDEARQREVFLKHLKQQKKTEETIQFNFNLIFVIIIHYITQYKLYCIQSSRLSDPCILWLLATISHVELATSIPYHVLLMLQDQH